MYNMKHYQHICMQFFPCTVPVTNSTEVTRLFIVYHSLVQMVAFQQAVNQHVFCTKNSSSDEMIKGIVCPSLPQLKLIINNYLQGVNVPLYIVFLPCCKSQLKFDMHNSADFQRNPIIFTLPHQIMVHAHFYTLIAYTALLIVQKERSL